jgi:hypothetical protein
MRVTSILDISSIILKLHSNPNKFRGNKLIEYRSFLKLVSKSTKFKNSNLP